MREFDIKSPHRRGFTLIELLVVIAIIALLAAIIFPVVNAAKANVKKTSCMNNLHNIAQAIKMFKLDEGRYPVQLFPYDPDADPALPGQGGKRGMQDAVGPLYPNYVKSIEIFHCPMDWQHEEQQYQGRGQVYIDDPNRTVNYLTSYSSSAEPDVIYKGYQYDSYTGQFNRRVGQDASGNWHIDPSDPLNGPGTGYEGRYYLFREPNANFVPDSPHYKRQLRFRNPPADTVITWCGYHRDYSQKVADDDWVVKKGSIDIVLFLDGSARAINTERVLVGVQDTQGMHYGFVEP